MSTSTINTVARIGVLWAGDPNAEVRVTPETCRLHRVFDALTERGLAGEPVVYSDEVVEQVRTRLLGLDGVLVWVNPIMDDGRDRTKLDAMLRDIADEGMFVSAHPDIILTMGTKEALVTTQSVGWGGDRHVYRTFDTLRAESPARLASGKARVLKQYRGHSGKGIWKVQLLEPTASPVPQTLVRARHAPRGSPEEAIPLADFFARCQMYFTRTRPHDRPAVPGAIARGDDSLLPRPR